jgi:hypothetical protein
MWKCRTRRSLYRDERSGRVIRRTPWWGLEEQAGGKAKRRGGSRVTWRQKATFYVRLARLGCCSYGEDERSWSTTTEELDILQNGKVQPQMAGREKSSQSVGRGTRVMRRERKTLYDGVFRTSSDEEDVCTVRHH